MSLKLLMWKVNKLSKAFVNLFIEIKGPLNSCFGFSEDSN